MLKRVCLGGHGETIEGIMLQYKAIRDRDPIPEHENLWMQELCDHVRGQLAFPLRVEQSPELYLPFLFKILTDLNANNEFRTFSLLPQKKIRTINITINSTILKDLHRELGTDVFNPEHAGIPLWDFYFDFDRVLPCRQGQQKIREFISYRWHERIDHKLVTYSV